MFWLTQRCVEATYIINYQTNLAYRLMIRQIVLEVNQEVDQRFGARTSCNPVDAVHRCISSDSTYYSTARSSVWL